MHELKHTKTQDDGTESRHRLSEVPGDGTILESDWEPENRVP